MTRVLVTGAGGFVGQALVRDLAVSGVHVRAMVRRPVELGRGIETCVVDDVADAADRPALFDGVDGVVHAAALVHRVREAQSGTLESYRRDNVEATRIVALAAAKAGVGRMVFLSSVKANGEGRGVPYAEDDPPQPGDAYGISKLEAEQALARVAGETGLETVVLRPPLVYGPGVDANFRALLRIADSPLPLPLGRLDRNARSLLYVGNLVSAIRLALSHSGAPGRTYLLRDGEDVSTAALIRRLRAVFGRPPGLVSVPVGVLEAGARIAGRPAVMSRIAGSLTVDDARVRDELGWRPPFSLDQGLAAAAAWHRSLSAQRAR